MWDFVQEVLHLYLLFKPGLLGWDLVSQLLLLVPFELLIVLQLILPVIDFLIWLGDVLLSFGLLAPSLFLTSGCGDNRVSCHIIVVLDHFIPVLVLLKLLIPRGLSPGDRLDWLWIPKGRWRHERLLNHALLHLPVSFLISFVVDGVLLLA